MTSGRRFRVLVVQPKGDVRLSDALTGDPGIEIAGVTTDGSRALSMTRRLRPNAVVIDAALADGEAFTATRSIMAELPTPVIIAIDDGARDPAQLRLEALQAGAIIAVRKPPDRETPEFAIRRSGLIAAVQTLGPMNLERGARLRGLERSAEPARIPERRATLVAIAASTGGPAALCRIFPDLPADFGAPILLTQHIASGFVDGMARWLNGLSSLHVKLAEDGEILRSGSVYVAPDNHHLIARDDGTVSLGDAPALGGHRPSATVMGRDGIDGLTEIRRSGGTVVAQDEASSTVFGMPKAAIEAGIVDRILPLDGFARHFIRAVSA
jgi:two-component system chemotaxis response regulator CheB